MVNIIEILATITIMIAVPLVAIPKRFGLWVMVLGQILWSIFAIMKGHTFFTIQSIFLLLVNFYGLYSWKRKGIK